MEQARMTTSIITFCDIEQATSEWASEVAGQSSDTMSTKLLNYFSMSLEWHYISCFDQAQLYVYTGIAWLDQVTATFFALGTQWL